MSVNPESKTVFEYPTKAMSDEYKKKRVTPYIIGFENNEQNGTGVYFNFTLSNGHRSHQRDEGYTYYDHLMPERCHSKIRSVNIHQYNHYIYGFSFFDKEGALLWEIGYTHSDYKVETVMIAEDERIVGVVAKLHPGYQSLYSDW